MKKEYKCFILFGVFCFFILMISLWYSVTFNDSRLVSPMNYENYVFRTVEIMDGDTLNFAALIVQKSHARLNEILQEFEAHP